jgi:hypothetical protein
MVQGILIKHAALVIQSARRNGDQRQLFGLRGSSVTGQSEEERVLDVFVAA